MRKSRRLLLVFAIVFLTGCSSTELEERCFPMLVTVGYEDGNVSYDIAFSKEDGNVYSQARGQDFEKSREKFESRLNKTADYNHLKVLVFEDDFLAHASQYHLMLDYLAESEKYPRNTYVCVTDDGEDLMELQKQISQDLGTYLEEYLKKHEEKKERLLTLGDLIDEKDNAEMVQYLPYLEVEDNFIEWRGYVNTLGKMWKDS